MKPIINKKYVSLLEEAFKKYKDVDIVHRSPTTQVSPAIILIARGAPDSGILQS